MADLYDYTHYHFGYNMIDRANNETNSIAEMRNFINLITDLYNIGWQRDELLSLLSQLYNVFEHKNDFCRCNEIDNAIDHVDNTLFVIIGDNMETSQDNDETNVDNECLCITPEALTNNLPFRDPPPLLRTQFHINDIFDDNRDIFDAEFYDNYDDGWRTVSNQLYY